jgi:hypothetical protein
VAVDTGAVTFEALGVVAVALLPGAVYTWSFERIAGRWGVALSDRLYRFIGLSAFYQALIAPITWKIWLDYLKHGASKGDELPIWLWPAGIGYLAIPAVVGFLLAKGFRSGNVAAKAFVGATAAPTAWDAVFSGEIPAYVLMRLKSGRWVGGEYADGSHVAGYPEPADIYLARELAVSQEQGDFELDELGAPRPLGGFGLLVRWSEIEYLEIAGNDETEEQRNGDQSE